MESLKTNKEKGASLVELIVVMAIIAILTSVAIVSYTVFIKRAKMSKAEQELMQVYNLIYMEADQRTLEIGQNNNLETALYVTTSDNKIVLMFNDVPTENFLNDEWKYDDITHWAYEDYWNVLLRELIDDVTGDIEMFTGLFELDPTEHTATFNDINKKIEVTSERNITYILDDDEELRTKRELIVTTVNDVETITKFLSEIEGSKGKLVPEGRISNDGEVELLEFEVWFVWTASAGHVLAENFTGELEATYKIELINEHLTEEELINANNLINGDGDTNQRLFTVTIEHLSWRATTDYPDIFIIKIKFNREPRDEYEYNLIQDSKVKIEFTVKISNIELVEKE